MTGNTTEYLDSYQKHLQTVGLNKLTIQVYSTDLEAFRQWFEPTRGKAFLPKHIVPVDLIDYRSYLQTVKKFRPTTVNRYLTSVARFLKWARGQGLTETLPPERLQKKAVQDTAPKSLNTTEQHALELAIIRGGNQRDIALIKLLLGTGLRSSEVANLKLDDLELLHRSANEEKGWVHVRAGKGGATRRVPLNSEVRKILRDYLEMRVETDTDYLFVGQRGCLTTKGVAYIVRRYAYLAQLEACSVHTLRHTFAKNLIDKGVSIDRVGHLLGHASLDTTRIYTKPTQADLSRDVEKLIINEPNQNL